MVTSIGEMDIVTMVGERFDLKDFTIVSATHDQIAQHARAAHVHWSHGRTFEDFLQATMREHDESPWGRQGSHEVWVLVKRDDLEGEIYAGCEVYRRSALIKRPKIDEVENGYMYGIASVVTPIPHLKRGYATHLLRLLHYQMADPTHIPPFPNTWGAPPPSLLNKKSGSGAIGSTLWSDVGYKFYEKCTVGEDRPGWVVRPDQNVELVWKCLPPSSSSEDDIENPSRAFSWSWIGRDGIADVTEYLSAKAKDRLRETQSDHTIYEADPASPGVLTWLSVRGPWLSKKKPQAGEPFGMRTKNADGEDTIVLFTAYNDHVGPRLLVTYTLNLHPEHLESLLERLDIIADRAGRGEGWIWGLNIEDDLVKAWEKVPGREVRKGYRDEFKGHLIGAAWYGPTEDAGEFGDWQIWDWC